MSINYFGFLLIRRLIFDQQLYQILYILLRIGNVTLFIIIAVDFNFCQGQFSSRGEQLLSQHEK